MVQVNLKSHKKRDIRQVESCAKRPLSVSLSYVDCCNSYQYPSKHYIDIEIAIEIDIDVQFRADIKQV